MLFLSILAILAPVAVVYDGGGVYLGGASSVIVRASNVITAGMELFGSGRSLRFSV